MAATTDGACPDITVLRDFEQGRLNEADHSRVGSHVASCPGCQSRLGRLTIPHDELAQASPGASATEPITAPAAPGYELLAEIGRGGMGVVYRARDTRLAREVAVKLLRDDFPADAAARERFIVESKITGQLQHPGIPAVHELSVAADGRPLLAMKLVQGSTLHDILQKRADPKQDRGRLIAIFEQVCQAVGYAHAHRVLHRDLKPGNIMVGAFGEVQVMDWGLAKLLPSDSIASGEQDGADSLASNEGGQADTPMAHGSETRTGAVLGTLAYMPPEQAGGLIHNLDARSDVFGLGAILCVILTGKPPYEAGDVQGLRLKAARGETDEAFARLDRCQAETDLVALCKRCLAAGQAKRPSDGGAVAREVAHIRQAAEERARQAEVQRAEAVVRENEERKRRRNAIRWAAALAAVLLLGIGGTTAGMLLARSSAKAEKTARSVAEQKQRQAESAAAAERIAKNEADRQRRTAQRGLAQIEKGVVIFAGILTGLDPRSEELGGTPLYDQLRLRAVQAADALVGDSVADPEATARLQSLLGVALAELGEPTKALEVLEQARATQTARLGADHPDTLSTLNRLANVRKTAGRVDEAISMLEQLRDTYLPLVGAEHPGMLATLSNLAGAYREAGRLNEAIPLLEQIRDLEAKRSGAGSDAYFDALGSLAIAYHDAGRFPEAIDLHLRVLDHELKTLGERHADVLVTRQSLAITYRQAGRLSDAIALLEKVREAQVVRLGPEHFETLTTMANLAGAYQEARRLPESIALFEQVRDVLSARLGPDHPRVLGTLANLAFVYQDAGRLPEAIAALEHSHRAFVAKLGPAHPSSIATMQNLALAYQDAGRSAEAIALFERASAAFAAKLGDDHPDVLATVHNLGRAYVEAGRPAEGLPLLEKSALGLERIGFQYAAAGRMIGYTATAYESAGRAEQGEAWRRKWMAALRAQVGDQDPAYASELATLGLNLLAQKKWEEAEAVLRDCLAIRQKSQPDAWSTFSAQSMLGAALLGKQDYAAAEPLLIAGYQGMEARQQTIPPPGRIRFREAIERVIRLLDQTGRQAEADQWFQRLDPQPPAPE